MPGAFVPAEDEGYFITIVQAPAGSSLEYTTEVMKKAVKHLEQAKIDKIIIDAAINDIDTLKTFGGAHAHITIIHDQVSAFDQFNSHLLGQEGMFEVS